MPPYSLVIVFIVCWYAPTSLADVIPIFPSEKLSIAEGAGFLAFLNPNGGTELRKAAVTDSHWIHCSVAVNNVQYSLDSDQIHRIGDKTTVERFDTERCGIRVKNLQKELEAKWTLYGTDQNGGDRTGVLEVSVMSIKFIDELNVTVSGSSSTATVNCPDKDGSRYCRIIDAEQVVSESCQKTVDLTQQISHFWCHVMFWGAMTERITKINLFVEGTCSLEIKKPLAPVDVGVWRIFQQLNPTDYTGCVFYVKGKRFSRGRTVRIRGSSMRNSRLELTATNIEIFRDPRSTSATVTELSCEVPYDIDYCYLSGPTGSDHTPQRFDRLKSLGICRFAVTNITSGMWACGINDLDGAEDHLTYYNVSVFEQPGQTVTKQLTASTGDRAQRLLCRTILDLPIDICRFVDPSGEVHGVLNQMKPSAEARYRYYGKGLREGECGLEIVELREKDIGWWKCLFKVRGREYEISMEIVEEAMSVGVIIGISIAATVVLGIIGIFAYRKLNRRYHGPSYTVSSSMTNVSNGSHQS
uniref:Ig-like domain-containing protein n=1 Tax=Anopheles culicifacies TaxID=139723 RepID=A0A182MEI0_9DIPT